MPLAIPFEQFPGLGHEDYPGFPTAECPPLPDLSRHCSVCADVLKAHPELYEQLKARATSKGVTLARCIKTGIDNRGHPVLKSLGAVAGDAECYDTFAPLFDKLIESRHGKVRSAESKPFGRRTLTTESAEPFDGYVISCKVTASRSIDGFRFPPAATRQDREEVERMLVDSAASMEGSLKGQYFPLMGSNSYPSKPGGMSATEEKMLADDHLLFYHPDAPAVLSTGSGRHWPHGRGVFVNARKTLTLWINEEEHLKATSQRAGGNVQAAYQELHAVLEQLSSKLPGRTFATSPRLGYLTSNPAILGTAMRVSAIVKLPLLKQSKEELQRWCASRRLVEKSAISQSGDRMIDLVEVSSRDKLNITQEETVDMLVEGIAQLVRAERLMEQGMSAAEALAQSRPRGDLTPVDPDPGCWDAAGNALRDMFSSAVLTSCGSELVGVPLETMQRLAGAFVVASEVGSLQDAAIGLQQARGATKIQALQRGRSERKLVEDAKGQKEVDSKARPATEDFEQLRVELREVLASAAQDGSLGRALAVPAEPEMADDEKEILRLQLESSLERGALAAALAEETEVIERDLEEVRLRMQSMLVQSLRDGALDAALQAVFSEQDQEDTRTIIAEQDLGITEDTEVECLRVRLAHQLQTSMMDGSLDAALAELTVESLDELRQRAASLLQSSFDNGQLQFVLSSRATEAAEAESLLALRSQAASQLLTALNDGSLEKALENTRSQDELRDRRLESLRHKVAGTLENALMDGSLQAALWNKEARKRDKEIVEDTKPSSEKHEGDVDALRQKAAVLLTTSCADGSLEAALSRKAVPSREKNGADVDAVRQKAAVLLTTSCADGSLEAALSRKAVPSREKNGADVDALRQKAAVLLTTSCADGSLEAALSRKAVSSTEKSDGDVDALRRNVAALLTASCADGSLEAALSSKASRDLEGIRNEVATLLEAATNDGSLEMAVKAVAGARSTEDEIESVRKKIAFRLQQSASDGTLGAALLTASRPESSEDLLFRMGQQLSEAFLDGTLEAALEATRSGDVPPARDNDDNMDHLKSMVAESLSSAFWDGSLEAALEASGSPPREQELGSQSTCQALAKPVRPPSAQARHGAAVLLKVMSTYDRRIGKLLEGIEASEREILARSQQMAMLQVQMEEAQSDLRSLELAWDKQQLALEREEVRDLKLHEESRTLRESLELEKLKQRHAALDQGHEMPYSSARSELTQAPSGRGLSSPPSTWRSHS